MDLVLHEVTAARGGVAVVDAVSARVPPGGALLLTGPNGAGKTTLLRVIAGLAPPAAGRIEGAADRVAYAGHADGLKATLTVAENLAFWAGLYGTASTEEAIESFDLRALAGRLAGHLSAGQRRRAGLARLLVTGRPLWVLDEPTASLDIAAADAFAALMTRHLAAGGQAVVATHLPMGLPQAAKLDLAGYRARAPMPGGFDEAFA